MQGYLKFKESNKELYEVDIDLESKEKNIFKNAIKMLIYLYLEFVAHIKKLFNIITVKEVYTGLIFILPISSFENNIDSIQQNTKDKIKQIYLKNVLKRYIKKLKKIMKKYEISTLVVADKLRGNKEFIQNFQDNRALERQIHILDGSEMMPYLIKEIIQYILQKKERITEQEDLYILVKQDCTNYRENIAFLSQYFKTINIVTPSLATYQKLANQLSQKSNAMLTITNNKSKSLRKAKWIVNMDMPAEEMKKYTIYRSSTIIYLQKDGEYKSNGFEGLHIYKAGIDTTEEIKENFNKQYLLKQCPITILYESTIINKKSFNMVKEQMKKDKVKITKLYGLRGELEEKEYEKVG